MLRNTLSDALKTAMKAREEIAVATLRMVLAALKDKDIAARTDSKGPLDDSQIMSLMQALIAQRRDSLALYEKGGRPELAERERQEIAIIQRFLPAMMSEGEMREAVAATIAEIGASGVKDMGKTMAALRGKFAGRMDFGQAGNLARQLLTA